MTRTRGTQVNRVTEAILERLTQGLTADSPSRTFDRRPGTFMAVHVERIGPAQFSVAHYFEQNGDLCSDPEMTFFRSADGHFYPLSFAMSYMAIYRCAAEASERGEYLATVFDGAEQKDQARFAADWMRNIRDQQGIS